MNRDIVKLISILAATIWLAGCGAMAPNSAADNNARPILSAAEAQTQIRVTVRTLPPAIVEDTLVAAND